VAGHDATRLTWRRSSTCHDDSCVEVTRAGREVRVRDSNDRAGKVLVIPLPAWEAFLAGLRND
jgi:Domain of unknown function (DUF397)